MSVRFVPGVPNSRGIDVHPGRGRILAKWRSHRVMGWCAPILPVSDALGAPGSDLAGQAQQLAEAPGQALVEGVVRARRGPLADRL